SELWAIDLGSSPSAIKVSRDGGQSWWPVQQLKDIATNSGEFDFTCRDVGTGNSRYGDKEVFGNQCSMTEMVFPPGRPQMRFAVLYPGGVAFSSNSGEGWISLNATNAQPSEQPIELPQSAFYDPGLNSAGESSLYLALEGKGVKRIDARFAQMVSSPANPVCTASIDCLRELTISCTGPNVGVSFNGNCRDSSGYPTLCYAGFTDASTVTAGGDVRWIGSTNQATACDTVNGIENCIVVAAQSPSSCPPPPDGPPPLCGPLDKWCARFNACVPVKECLVGPPTPK
ncbi:MAG: hypothetical protein WBW33_30195, partial [Bryobacteraceae bacterium]